MHTVDHMHQAHTRAAAVLTGTTVAMVRSLLLLRQREKKKQLRLLEFDSGFLYLSSFPGQVVDQSLWTGGIAPPTPDITAVRSVTHTQSHTQSHASSGYADTADY